MKCTNCGASIEDDNGRLNFCPYCGSALPKQEDPNEFTKFVIQHDEKVRQKKVKESNQGLLGLLAMVVVLALIYVFAFTIPHNRQVAELEALVIEIQNDIIEGRLDEAEVKTTRIRLDSYDSGSERRKWDNQRKELEKLIKQKRGH